MMWVAFFLLHSYLFGTLLSIDLEYAFNYANYRNLDFKGDTLSFFHHRFTSKISILKENIEFGLKMQSLGVVGSTTPFRINDYVWEKTLPISLVKTNFEPFIEQAFVRLINPFRLPLEILLGRQSIEFDNGFILSDNLFGLNGMRIIAHYPVTLRTNIFFINLLRDAQRRNFNIYGIHAETTFHGQNISALHLTESDATGLGYMNSTSLNRSFVTLCVSTTTHTFLYNVIAGYSYGQIMTQTKKIRADGYGFSLNAGLIAKKTYFGESILKLVVLYGNGDKPETADVDESFRPILTKRFDGLLRKGCGNFFSASLYDAFNMPQNYSGMISAGFNFMCHPIEKSEIGISYFSFFSKNQATTREERIGSEFDFSASYRIFKTVSVNFLLSIFLPEKKAYGLEKDIDITYVQIGFKGAI